MIVKMQPRLKSFLCQNRCITICAMNALLKLVAREESGKPATLSKDFDRVLEEQGLVHCWNVYPYSGRFFQITTLILVQACRLYLECDFIIVAMMALANFTNFVTMPYVNFVEKSLTIIWSILLM